MRKSNFLEGTLIATIAIFLVKIIGIVYVIPFYAIIGTTGSALYAYAYNIYVMFLDISTAGIPNAISKIVKEFDTLKQKEAKVRTIKIGTKLILTLSIICFITLFIFAKPIALLILGSDIKGGNTINDVCFVIRCVSFCLTVVPLLSIFRGYLQGHKIISVSSGSQLVEQLVRVAVLLLGSYLAIKVFGLPIKYGVGIATFAAFLGGLSSLIYVLSKYKKNKKQLSLGEKLPVDKEVTDKSIMQKIIKYAIPMIMVSISVAIYDNVDMILILRFTKKFGYEGALAEFVSTTISTWSKKIANIVTSIGTGLVVSLIPSMVEAYTLKDNKLLNSHFNKALQIILTICIPMVVGLSILAGPVWTIFYGYNSVGQHILSVNIFTSILLNLFMVTNFTLQSVNDFKIVYKSAIAGYLTNIVLDIVFMNVLYVFGLPIYYGAIIASICGYIVSISIALHHLNNEFGFKYQETLDTLKKMIIPIIILIAMATSLNIFLPFNEQSRVSMIIKVIVVALPSAITYIYLMYKLKIIDKIFGKDFFKKIKNKIMSKLHKK